MFELTVLIAFFVVGGAFVLSLVVYAGVACSTYGLMPVWPRRVSGILAGAMWAILPFTLATAACQPTCPDLPPMAAAGAAKPCPPPPPADAGSPHPATCAGACARGAELGCAWATPTPEGVSCEAVCANAQANGYTLSLACRAAAASCAAADACPAK